MASPPAPIFPEGFAVNLPPYTLTQISPPDDEPLAIEEAKAFLQINFAGPNAAVDDALVGDLITAAREDCEFRTGRSFISQRWRLEVDVAPSSHCWGSGRTPPDPAIQLPKGPLISVQAITYLDGSGATRTLDPSTYRVVPGTTGRIVPTNGQPLPLWNSMAVEFTSGFGTEPSDVPQNIRQAIKHYAAFMYVNRADDAPPPVVVDRLLSKWRRPAYA